MRTQRDDGVPRATDHARINVVSYVSCTGTLNETEAVMKITVLTLSLVMTAALAAWGQEGAVENAKEGAKKAGQTIKNGVETAGEKTKEAAETVGEKTKETAKTVGRKTKEAAQTAGQKTEETAKTAHRKAKKKVNNTRAETGDQQPTNQAPNTPAPTDR